MVKKSWLWYDNELPGKNDCCNLWFCSKSLSKHMRCMCLGSENIEYELFLPKVVKGCGWKAFDVCKKEEEAFDVEEDFLHKELHCHHFFVRTVKNLFG